MISPELLRRYTIFAELNDEQLKAIAMISNENTYPVETNIIDENSPAKKLFLIKEGEIDLIYSGGGEGAFTYVVVGTITPGEILGVSSLIEPYEYISSAKVISQARVIEIDAPTIRALMEVDPKLGCILLRNISTAVMERLKYTQIELAAARA